MFDALERARVVIDLQEDFPGLITGFEGFLVISKTLFNQFPFEEGGMRLIISGLGTEAPG